MYLIAKWNMIDRNCMEGWQMRLFLEEDPLWSFIVIWMAHCVIIVRKKILPLSHNIRCFGKLKQLAKTSYIMGWSEYTLM
jgi:hypothetical protein